MKEDTVKMLLAAFSAAVWSYFKTIFAPVVILIVVMTVDYISGVAAAWVRHELSSRVGLIGIVKKLSYLALVVAGCSIDYLVNTLGQQLTGAEISIKAIGLTVVCWLIINELISILENLDEVGVPLPGFLRKIVYFFLKKVEDIGDAATPNEEEGKNAESH